MRRMSVCFILLICCIAIYAQVLDVEWFKTYGGSSTETCNTAIRTSDGGFLLGGYTRSFTSTIADGWLVKLDINGDEEWSKSYPGISATRDFDNIYSLFECSNGDFLVAGTMGTGLDTDMHTWMFRVNSSGDTIFTSACSDSTGFIKSALQADNGNYIYGKNFNTDYHYTWIYELDATASTQLKYKKLTSAYLGDMHPIIYTYPRNGYFLGLIEHESTYPRYNVVRMDSTLSIVDDDNFASGHNDYLHSIHECLYNPLGYVLGGQSYNKTLPNEYDMRLCRIGYSGSVVWEQWYGGAEDENCFDFIPLTGEEFIAGGTTESWGAGNMDIYLVKMDDDGNELWHFIYGGTGYDVCRNLFEVAADEYIITGYQSSYGAGAYDFFIMKLNEIPDTFDLVYPPNNTYVDSFLFIWEASQDWDMKEYYFVLNGSNIDTLTDTVLTISSLSEGNYTWYISEMDSLGNSNNSLHTYSFTFDTTPPSANNLIYPDDAILTNDSMLIWSKADDNVSGVEYYEIDVSLDYLFTNDTLYTTTDTSMIYDLPDTIYFWRVRSVDYAGNESSWSDIWEFCLDRDVPDAITVLSPVNDYYSYADTIEYNWSPVTKSIKSIDYSSPVMYVYELSMDTLYSSLLVCDTIDKTTETIYDMNEGQYYWRVKAFDFSLNVGPYTEQSIGIDRTNPEINMLTSYNAVTFMGPFEIYVEADDAISGIDSVMLFYKKPDDTGFVSTRMNDCNDYFLDSIPISTKYGNVYYYIVAYDRTCPQNVSYDPWLAPASLYAFEIVDLTGVGNRIEKFHADVNTMSDEGIDIMLAVPDNEEISINVYDVKGSRVNCINNTQSLQKGIHNVHINLEAKGIYFIEFSGAFGKITKKTVQIK